VAVCGSVPGPVVVVGGGGEVVEVVVIAADVVVVLLGLALGPRVLAELAACLGKVRPSRLAR